MLKRFIHMDIERYIACMDKVFYGILAIIVIALLAVGTCVYFEKISFSGNESFAALPTIRLIIDALAVVSLFLVVMQSCLNRKHTENDYILKRSHKAIDLMMSWSIEVGNKSLIARHIVDNMSLEECRKLYNYESVVIMEKDYSSLCMLFNQQERRKKWKNMKKNPKGRKKSDMKREKMKECPHMQACSASKQHPLELDESLLLRSYTVKYLNALEVVLAAWQSGVIDKDIIEKEFEYLVTTHRDGKTVLENFRKVAGTEGFPGISSFCNHMEQKQKKELEPKDIKA